MVRIIKKRESLCKKHIHFLSYVNSLSNIKRKKIIQNISTKEEINSILEVFINFMNKNISCKKKIIKSIVKHKNYFNRLIKKSNSVKNKKRMLNSKIGGFLLQTILGLAIPLLTNLFRK